MNLIRENHVHCRSQARENKVSRNGIQLLYDVSSRLNSDLDIDRVLTDVLDLTVHRVGASNGSILIFDEHGTVAHKILARVGMLPEKAQAVIDEVLSQGLAGWVVQERKGALVDDVLTDNRWISFADDDFMGGSAVAVPLLRRRLVGVLTLRHVNTGHFQPEHLLLLTSIADQAAIAIENARLFFSMQQERAKLKAIIDNAGDAILVCDSAGHVLMLNAVALQALGLEGDPNGKKLSDLFQSPALEELWERRDHPGHPGTAEVSLEDGRTLYASLARAPQVGFVFVMQDITPLKQIDQLKSQFVNSATHDLRSPLQMIMTYTGLLANSDTLSSQQQDFVAGINRSVAKMTDLIDDLLDLAKIEAGVHMERQECRMDEILIDVLQRFEEMIAYKGLELELDLPSDLPPVQANIDRIDQVISNLIDNAVKYTPSGKITVQAAHKGGQVSVHVSDTGIGLMPQEKAQVFTRFYRAKNEWTEKVNGTGLGLVMVKAIVEQYHGKIWVQSHWQHGSTFSFSLPTVAP